MLYTDSSGSLKPTELTARCTPVQGILPQFHETRKTNQDDTDMCTIRTCSPNKLTLQIRLSKSLTVSPRLAHSSGTRQSLGEEKPSIRLGSKTRRVYPGDMRRTSLSVFQVKAKYTHVFVPGCATVQLENVNVESWRPVEPKQKTERWMCHVCSGCIDPANR